MTVAYAQVVVFPYRFIYHPKLKNVASLVVVCIYTVNNEKREFLEVDLTHENFCSNQILKTKQLALFNKESGYGTKKIRI